MGLWVLAGLPQSAEGLHRQESHTLPSSVLPPTPSGFICSPHGGFSLPGPPGAGLARHHDFVIRFHVSMCSCNWFCVSGEPHSQFIKPPVSIQRHRSGCRKAAQIVGQATLLFQDLLAKTGCETRGQRHPRVQNPTQAALADGEGGVLAVPTHDLYSRDIWSPGPTGSPSIFGTKN